MRFLNQSILGTCSSDSTITTLCESAGGAFLIGDRSNITAFFA